MPNHCSNKLTLTGAPDKLKQFADFAMSGESKLDIGNFMPMPEEVRNTTAPNPDKEQASVLRERYGASDWYDWANVNWGTKWGVYRAHGGEVEGDTLIYYFSTAWSPFSENVLLAMSGQFPEIRMELKYAEIGMGFWGLWEAIGGSMTNSEEGDVEMKVVEEDNGFGVRYELPDMDDDFTHLLETSG